MTAKEFFEQNRGKYFKYSDNVVRVVGYGNYRGLITIDSGWEYNKYKDQSISYIDESLISNNDKLWFVDIDNLTPIDQPELDLCKILEGFEGMTFYSPIFGDVILISVNFSLDYPITVILSDGCSRSFYKNGLYLDGHNGECMLFPSKENRDWSTFVKPNKIKDGTPVMCFDDGNFIWVLDNFKESSIDGYYKWIVPVSEFDFSDFDSNKSKSII